SYDEAESSYLSAIEKSPSNGMFYNNLAWLYIYGRHDLNTAERFAKDAARLDPSRKYIYSDTLGVIYTYKNDFKTAEEVFKDALNAAPPEDASSLAHIYTHMIALYAKSGDEENLQKIREKLKGLSPANNTPYRIPHH
ncbi:MAG: tetratricopeptide repeat protein, partial [Deltaproteobacteria bacterium]|nr:tetratricopeptide repeat protein [Deltaproteobacteria bacterium]